MSSFLYLSFLLYFRKKETADSENRDARTVFVMQLSQRVRERDLKEFFVAVGKVRSSVINVMKVLYFFMNCDM